MTDQADGSGPPVLGSRRARADIPRTTASAVADDFDLEEERPPRSSRPGTLPPRWETVPAVRTRRRFHPLFWLGVSLGVLVLGWIGVTQAVTWGTNTFNTLRYGYPHTCQIDAVVSHNDSASAPSHFLAINLRGRIEVIEWPGGDAAHARVYMGPQLFGTGSDQAPVTLRFVDLNGDHLPDMVIVVQGSQIVFINDQGSFRPMKPGEQNQMIQRLRQLGQ